MILDLTLRTSNEEWSKDLELGLGNIGVYRIEQMRNELVRNMNSLVTIISSFAGINARLITPLKGQDFWIGITVIPQDNLLPFEAYVSYGVDKQHKLFAKIHFTDRPSTAEFPIEGGYSWKTEILYESEIKDTRYTVANVKNHFIIYESFKRIGRDIIYSVLEE
ncbi:MAG: hypothetical protein ACK5D5_04515 [Bacteroidota bacterium]|jgi:hypothetical protein